VPKSQRNVLRENIEALLLAKQMNPYRLAKEAKVAVGTVHNLLQEQGTNVQLDILERLARALGVPVWRLLRPATEATVADYTEEALELAALFDAIPSEFERARANAIARLVLAGLPPPAPAPPAPAPAPARSEPRPVAHAGAPSRKPHRRK
jgi:transcriptional regulator with XRE-family HTH domain